LSASTKRRSCRNHRYGSIVCDLERRRIVTLLPDRELAIGEDQPTDGTVP
jgi:hypothetical protein